jgi:hypothetical protein
MLSIKLIYMVTIFNKFIFNFILLLMCSCIFINEGITIYKIEKIIWETTTNQKKNKSKILTWTMPSNWEKKLNSTIRIGSFNIRSTKHNAKADVSIILLKNQGGGLVDNINRWREQLELPPVSKHVIKSKIKIIKSQIGLINYIIIENLNTDKAIYAGINFDENHTIFVKAIGSISLLKNHEKEFESLIRSLRVN